MKLIFHSDTWKAWGIALMVSGMIAINRGYNLALHIGTYNIFLGIYIYSRSRILGSKT